MYVDHAPSSSSKLALSQAEEPGYWYASLGYMYSSAEYDGKNIDSTSTSSGLVQGGHADVRLGHWFGQFGFLFKGTYSAWTSEGHVFHYTGVGALAGFRIKTGAASRFRIWAGYSANETPDIVGDATTQTFKVHAIRNAGPEVR